MQFPDTTTTIVYLAVLLGVWIPYGWRRSRQNRRSQDLLQTAHADGLLEPASLHPLIDPTLCFGCSACVDACPEKNVLGLVHGKAVLTTPANCIGHGACREACPAEAITLVLGTETRGVDIPWLGEDFQTNVPGIFVAGELGGMGLIRNAIEQGQQALASIATHPGVGSGELLDVVIVGAGPAGLSASLAAMQRGLSVCTIEQESLGGTVAHYPRGKIVMTAPVNLPLYGKVKLRETTKEALLDLWNQVAQKTGVRIRYDEQVTAVTPLEKGFRVETTRDTYTARTVLLAIGRRGTPRKVGVPGEELDKVAYRLIDSAQYAGHHVLVVGGGDSALEAAVSLSEEPGTWVTLVYRGAAFSRAKAKNRERIERAQQAEALQVFFGSEIREIFEKTVDLCVGVERITLPNDAIIVCTGGILPTSFLREMGIEIETKRGTA